MLAWRLLSKARDKETVKLLGVQKGHANGYGGDQATPDERSSASGIALQDLRNKLTRRNRNAEKDQAVSV